MKSVALITLAGAIAVQGKDMFNGEKVVSLKYEDITAEVATFLNDMGSDTFGHVDGMIDIRVPVEAKQALEDMGISLEDTTDKWLEHLESNLNNPDMFCNDGVAQCASRNAQDFYASYQDYDVIISRLEGLVADSDIASMETLGQSYEGRDMKIIEIGDQTKPLIFMFCNIHAREWLTPMFCSYFVETLLTEGHGLLQSFSFGIVPSANPDGYMYSRNTDTSWRKTRKPNSGSSCIGTDGNRNWDNNHCGVGSSTNPCSETYCGVSPFDNPEVSLLNQYTLSNINRVIASLDMHSYGSKIIHPYGYTTETPPEPDYTKMRSCAAEAKEAADAEAGGNWEYGTTPQTLGYTSGGTSKDYMYGNLGVIYSYTVEFRGTSFQPSTANIAISNREVMALVEAMLICIADYELGGAPTGPPSFTAAPTRFPTPPPTPTCIFFC